MAQHMHDGPNTSKILTDTATALDSRIVFDKKCIQVIVPCSFDVLHVIFSNLVVEQFTAAELLIFPHNLSSRESYFKTIL